MTEGLSLEGAFASLSNATGLPVLALSPEEVDPETCRLLGPLALAVQGVMGCFVLLSLVLKRAREKPRRKWRVWSADVSKQVLGQAFVHGSNVAISDLIARHKADNPCSLYALNIAVDTTLGVGILFVFLKSLTSLLRSRYPTSFRTGDYGDPFQISIWAKQAAVYVLALALMKAVVVLLFWAIPALFVFANWCLSWLSSDEAQVVFVMLLFPLVMNVIQFLVVDSILKSNPNLSSPFMPGDEESRRGFLETSSDNDEDDDDEQQGPHTSISHAARARKLKNGLEASKYGGVASSEGDDTQGTGSGSTTPTATTGNKRAHSYPPSTSLDSTPKPTPKPPPQLLEDAPESEREDEDARSSLSSFEDWGESTTSLPEKRRSVEVVQPIPLPEVRWAAVHS